MAKKKNKKKDANKLPKTIAGVKVPKQLRSAGKTAQKIAQNPIVSEAVIAGLTAAATALVAKGSRTQTGRKIVGEVEQGAHAAGDTASQVKAALKTAAAGLWTTVLAELERDKQDRQSSAAPTDAPKHPKPPKPPTND